MAMVIETSLRVGVSGEIFFMGQAQRQSTLRTMVLRRPNHRRARGYPSRHGTTVEFDQSL